MAKFSKDQLIGIILLIVAILIWVPIPLVSSFAPKLAALAIVILGLYELFFR
ncbi:MAG: hypothetical protein QXD13_00610 [Candidatus Pacearchaeota archaeon]